MESGRSILNPPSNCTWKTFDWTFINKLKGWNSKEGKVKNLSPRIVQHLGRDGNWNAKEGKWELVGMQLGLPGDGKYVETGRDEEEQECVVNICDQSS